MSTQTTVYYLSCSCGLPVRQYFSETERDAELAEHLTNCDGHPTGWNQDSDLW